MKMNGFYSMLFWVFLLNFSMVHAQNMITDGDFSLTTEIPKDFDGPTPDNIWWTWQDFNVNAKASVVNQQLHYKIRSSGNQTYAIQLIQTGFSLEPGHSYKLSFDVKADANRTFNVFLGESWGNWTNHLGPNKSQQNATTEWRTISIEFDVYTVFPERKLSFDFGTINTSVYIDNVTLIDLGVMEEPIFSELSALNEEIHNPGFRPESTLEKTFMDSYKESKFLMYPTIIRSPKTTTWSKSLSKEFAQNLKSVDDLDIRLIEEKLDPGELEGKAQFQFFKNDMERLGSEIKKKKEDTDYYMIPEILFEPQRNGTIFVFGIHVFVLNSEGENVFSFLMNSHHDLYHEGKLYAYNPFDSEVEAMKQRALVAAARAFNMLVQQTDAQLN